MEGTSGTQTPSDLISSIKTRYRMTEEQEEAVKAWGVQTIEGEVIDSSFVNEMNQAESKNK
jgi:hypothetical protein